MDLETKHTPGPWEYVPSNEHHGPYVSGPFGGDICDCYMMSNPTALSVRNGGDSRPIHFQHEDADANARLIAAAPDLLEALKACVTMYGDENPDDDWTCIKLARAAIAKATGEAAAHD